jgi:hypothetical protein
MPFPCNATTVPLLNGPLKATAPRGMWATCLRSASSGYHAEFHEGCYQKQTSSSVISVYHTDFYE